ncbi:hypothetical protein HaLaN_12944 [Haematococcus lacustris]|uniref:Uncharacterized protein n=1 Tax=Haematococcus lacustris TaxID=44745 RepID=A0A699ZC84_HAELA|nr:hypothetical protein HaLaN_12944 [Haematococcus lacustris]
MPRPVPEDPDSDIEDRDEALQPDLTEAERKRKASGEARAARDRDNTYHGRMCKLAHLIDHLPQELWDPSKRKKCSHEWRPAASGGANGGDSQLQQYNPRKQDTKPLTKVMCVACK